MVYLIQAGPYIKIGASSNVKKRFKALQTACPYDLNLIAIATPADSYELEGILHGRYHNYLKRGEWFLLSADVVDEIIKENNFLIKGEFLQDECISRQLDIINERFTREKDTIKRIAKYDLAEKMIKYEKETTQRIKDDVADFFNSPIWKNYL